MNSRDRKYIPGGTDHEDDGNYDEDHSIASRAGRLYMMERGRWPAARGLIKRGSRIHELKKIDEHTVALAQRYTEQAFEPLTSTGEMGAVEVNAEFIPGREDALGNTVVWTDNTQGDSLTHERSSGRQG